MKKTSGFFSAAVTAVMILVSVTVLVFLCAGAVKLEKNANNLTKAVIYASSTSEAFYSADDKNELAELLSGKAEGNVVTAKKDGLCLFAEITEESGIRIAEISVEADGEPLYSLSCRKALVTEGG